MPTSRARATLLAQPLSLDEVMGQHPILCDHGFGVFDARNKPRGIRDAELKEGRKALRARAAHIKQVMALIQLLIRPVSACEARSYTVKHRVENEMDVYTTNGELIAAALMAGYPYERDGDGPNLLLGMDVGDVYSLPGCGCPVDTR